VDPTRENWNCIFEGLVVVCERLEELDIEGAIETSNTASPPTKLNL